MFNMPAIFKFGHKEDTNPKYELYAEMRSALYAYTNTLNEYKSILDQYSEFSTLTQVAYAKMEHYRTEYYKLRLEYERDYGNAENYEDSLSRFEHLAQKTGLMMLMRPINDKYLRNRILG